MGAYTHERAEKESGSLITMARSSHKTEKQILREIQTRLTEHGHRVFRNNVGILKDERGNRVRYGLCPGSSDLIGWTRRGKFLAVEVKGPKGKMTEKQENFLDAVNAFGGVGIMARSADEAVEKTGTG